MSEGGMESIARPPPTNLGGGVAASAAASGGSNGQLAREKFGFQMPLHYPRYSRAEYEEMPEWKLDCLLAQYGLPVNGDVKHKRKFAMGAFLWSY